MNVRVISDGDPEPRRVFVSVEANEDEQRYMPVDKALADAEMRESVKAQLKAELVAFARRNEEFRDDEELGPVFRAIARLEPINRPSNSAAHVSATG